MLTFTLFSDLAAKSYTRHDTDMSGFVEWLRDRLPEYPTKAACPLVSLARYGDTRSARGSLRHDANIIETTGLVGDYDSGHMKPATATAVLEVNGIEGVIVTTPSHGVKGSRWRVFVPLSEPCDIDTRHRLTGQLNAFFSGAFAAESFAASQAYYVGRVTGVPYEVYHVKGVCIDKLPHLAAVAPVGPPQATRGAPGDVDPLAALAKVDRGGVDHVRQCLELIPNEHPDWHHWNKVGMAVYAATGGTPEGLEAWEAWSDKCLISGNSEDSPAARWEHYRTSPPRDLGTGTLVYLAKQVAPQEYRAIQVAQNAAAAEGADIPCPTVLTIDQMYDQLVYIGETGAVVHRPSGRIRAKHVAGTEYAASIHRWVTDEGEMKEAPAYNIWLKSPNRHSVDLVTWDPGAGVIAPAPLGEGKAYNTWRGFPPLEAPDDWESRVEPFINHVTYLVPQQAERERFMQWLAHIVQRPHELPHTCYLMVTATTGIGRNWLSAIMVRVLRGFVAPGVQLSKILDGGFNGVLSRKVLAVVDETREGMGDRRYARAEKLKSLITEEYRHIDPKYGLQSVEKNCCRWLMLSNHTADALPIDNADRRVNVIANPDVRRSVDYYEGIYSLLDRPGFAGSVRQYLATLDLTGFRPGMPARHNEAKGAMLETLKGDLQRQLEDFRGDWPAVIATWWDVRNCLTPPLPKPDQLSWAARGAGMEPTQVRVRTLAGRDRLVIVKPDLITVDQVKGMSHADLIELIGRARDTYNSN